MDETATDGGTISGQADIGAFIARWKASGAAERANYQLYLSELCDVLGVPRPDRPKFNELLANKILEEV